MINDAYGIKLTLSKHFSEIFRIMLNEEPFKLEGQTRNKKTRTMKHKMQDMKLSSCCLQ